MTERIPLGDLTSDALDALYERFEAAEETELARQLATCDKAFASATFRAARAEVRANKLEAERDQYAAAIRQLILQVKQTSHIWATTLPDTILTADVTRALHFLCSPVPLPDDLRDDLWQRISAAYYVRFENDGHPEDATAAADVAITVVRPELEQLEQRVAELTAGQCTHALTMCLQHHAKPVDGCPYPRCIAARKRAEEQAAMGIYAPDPDCETRDVRTCTTTCPAHGNPKETARA